MYKEKSGLATASLVLGIIGVCLSFIPIVNNVAFVLGVLGIIFSFSPLIKNKSRGKAIAGLILGVLAVVITLYMQKTVSDAVDDAVDDFNNSIGEMSGDKTDEILEKCLDVQIGEFKVDEGEYLTETELAVTVKNKGDEKYSFSVTIEAVDKDGNRIDSDIAYINDLNAGQSTTEKLFYFVSSDKIEDLKNAEFKILEVSKY